MVQCLDPLGRGADGCRELEPCEFTPCITMVTMLAFGGGPYVKAGWDGSPIADMKPPLDAASTPNR